MSTARRGIGRSAACAERHQGTGGAAMKRDINIVFMNELDTARAAAGCRLEHLWEPNFSSHFARILRRLH